MLKTDLIKYRHYCESEFDASSRLSSMFRPRRDYPAKIAAINKLLLDIDAVKVQYTSHDLEMLNQGKLQRMLMRHQDELPGQFKQQLVESINCKFD